MWLSDRGYKYGEEGVSLGVCEYVWGARDFKVERLRCGWLDFRKIALACAFYTYYMSLV